MSEFLALLRDLWWVLLGFVLIVLLAALTNLGLVRSAVSAARPASAWGAIFCSSPAAIYVVLAAIVAGRPDAAPSIGAVIGVVVAVSLVLLVGWGLYLIFARRPPQAFVPRWVREQAQDRGRTTREGGA